MQHEENTLISQMLKKSRDMQRDDPMSKMTEAALVAAAQSGDEAAMTRLLEYHALFVMSKALRYRTHYDVNDLFLAGLDGLMKGVRLYDPSRNCGLLSYATHWISQRIRAEIYNNFNTIRIPIHAVGAVFAFRKSTRTGVEPDFKAMQKSSHGRMSIATIKNAYAVSMPACSLDSPNLKISANDGDEVPLIESIRAYDGADPDGFSEMDYLNRVMLEALSPRERYVMVEHNVMNRTLEDLAREIGLSRERIRQINNIAAEKMRRRMETHERQCDAKRNGKVPLATLVKRSAPCPS